ncbi:hypothetical protein PRIPAC_92268 [Pristionchus pacificus]|nr:hypothetical protein PRIPAC_92268 [Pristionchus pacificus]
MEAAVPPSSRYSDAEEDFEFVEDDSKSEVEVSFEPEKHESFIVKQKTNKPEAIDLSSPVAVREEVRVALEKKMGEEHDLTKEMEKKKKKKEEKKACPILFGIRFVILSLYLFALVYGIVLPAYEKLANATATLKTPLIGEKYESILPHADPYGFSLTGIFISAVKKGSMAEQANLHRGNQILSVNSIAVEGLNHDKLIALVEKVKSQKGTLKLMTRSNLEGLKLTEQLLELVEKKNVKTSK